MVFMIFRITVISAGARNHENTRIITVFEERFFCFSAAGQPTIPCSRHAICLCICLCMFMPMPMPMLVLMVNNPIPQSGIGILAISRSISGADGLCKQRVLKFESQGKLSSKLKDGPCI